MKRLVEIIGKYGSSVGGLLIAVGGWAVVENYMPADISAAIIALWVAITAAAKRAAPDANAIQAAKEAKAEARK